MLDFGSNIAGYYILHTKSVVKSLLLPAPATASNLPGLLVAVLAACGRHSNTPTQACNPKWISKVPTIYYHKVNEVNY